MEAPLAVVTGGNRGIGREVVRQLSAAGWRVVLTARDPEKARQAAEGLAQVRAEVLDVADPGSIEAFAAVIEGEGRIDALVNNAGVLGDAGPGAVRETMAVNFHGPLRLTDRLRPLLGKGSRVVLVSSGLGRLAGWPARLRVRVGKPDIGRGELLALAREYEAGAAGWPSSAYGVSKALLNALARVLHGELHPHGVLVNAVCPGWVRTDMGGRGAPRSVEQGAASVVWAATLPPDGPSGGFFRDGEPMEW